METIVQDLKGLLQYLVPLALLLAVALLRGYFKRAAQGQESEVMGSPPEEPTLERFHSAPRSDVSSVEGRPGLPREPEVSPRSRREDRALDRSPVERKPVASGTGRRLRRLLAQPEGRRVALLVHEIFQARDGCGRDETGRQIG